MTADDQWYVCYMCGGTFEKENSDVESLVEMVDRFGNDALLAELVLTCDDCDQKFMAWWESLPQAERERRMQRMKEEVDGG